MNKSTSAESTSLVSREVVIEGEISGDENLHVDGRINGAIRLSGDLFVGAGGSVEAEIDARNIVVQGTVTGKVTARQQLEIQPTGRFNGECTAASIEIREGALFEGTSRMITAAPPKSGGGLPVKNPP
ncbi:MAG: polymer-forming cytoskeletal protein [Desulfobacterales bacterium]